MLLYVISFPGRDEVKSASDLQVYLHKLSQLYKYDYLSFLNDCFTIERWESVYGF